MLDTIFNEFATLMSLSVLMGFIAIKLRQPLILSFIIVGIIAGPHFFGWISAQSEIEVLASFGITLLLFIVGLKLDLDLIKNLGSVVLIAGLGQIALTAILGGVLGLMMGMPFSSAAFVAFTLTFSSTIIIIKLLSDNAEIDSLYGRIAVGILIVQDLIVVIAIIVLSSLNMTYESYAGLAWEISELLLKGIGFLATLGLLMRFVFPTLLEHLAKSRELLILFAIALAVMMAVTSDALGFGREVGGFLAGVTLASSRYREAIASRLETVRNILLLFFFVNLGASLRLDALGSEIVPALTFSLFVLLGKPLIVMTMMGVLCFRKRTGFLTGITMGQISEFSLILATMGYRFGYIDTDTQGLITFVGLVTIAISTYMMTYANVLYKWLQPWLSIFERKMTRREDVSHMEQYKDIDVIIYGFGRHGEHIARLLEKSGHKILAIDFDPRRINVRHDRRLVSRYGDAEDFEFTKMMPLDNIKWVISTIPHGEANKMLVSSLREVNFKGKIAISVYQESELDKVKKLGVDMILIPYEDAASSAAEKIAKIMLEEKNK